MALTLIANLDPGLQCRNTLNAVIDLVGANHPWTPGSIPYTDAGGDYAQDNTNFFWDATLKDLHIGGAYYVSSARALYVVPGTPENNWFEGNAGNQTLSGYGNFGTGDLSLSSLTTGTQNVAVGTSALKTLTSGTQNFGLGSGALQYTVSDSNNVAIGTYALNLLGFGGIGGGGNIRNVAMGYAALANMQLGDANVGVGFSALGNVGGSSTTAKSNTVIGNQAGAQLGLSGTGIIQLNTLIGSNAGSNLSGASGSNVWIGGYTGPSGGVVSQTCALSTGDGAYLLDLNLTSVYNCWSFSFATNNTPPSLHLYNFQSPKFTTTNYERVEIGWDYASTPSNVFFMVSRAGGSGTKRLICIDGFAKAGAPANTDLMAGSFAVIDDTSANKTWLAFNKAGTIRQTEIGGGGGGGGMSIGGSITGGTASRVLFTGAGGILDDDSTFLWNDTLKDLAIGGAYYVNAARALYVVPHVTENNWFEGNAGNQTVTGYGNFGTGDNALHAVTTGYDNVAVGSGALKFATSAFQNFGMGSAALEKTVSDSYNVAVGFYALRQLGVSGAGSGNNTNNVAIGYNALGQAEQANNNVIIGWAGLSNLAPPATAQDNTIVGARAGANLGSSATSLIYSNTMLGAGSGLNLTGASNLNTWVGGWQGASATMSETIALSTGSARYVFDCNVTTAHTWSLHYAANGEPVGFHIYGLMSPTHGITNYERVSIDYDADLYGTGTFWIHSQAGGSGTKRKIAIDGAAKAGAPAAADLPSGSFSLIDDTSAGQTWLVFNKAGTIRKVQLT